MACGCVTVVVLMHAYLGDYCAEVLQQMAVDYHLEAGTGKHHHSYRARDHPVARNDDVNGDSKDASVSGSKHKSHLVCPTP